MNGVLFRYKWVMLAFLVLVLAGVQYLVGSEGREGALARVQDEAGEPPGGARLPDGTGQPPGMDGLHNEMDMDVMPDEDLIDSAEGFDPTPPDEGGFDDGEFVADAPPDGAGPPPEEGHY